DVRGSPGGEEGRGNGQHSAGHQHQLPAVAIPERSEPEHRAGEAERVADGDEVERRLARVEVRADRGESDVRDRQVQVRDPCDKDQRREDEPCSARRGRRSTFTSWAAHEITLIPTHASRKAPDLERY